MSNSVNLHIDSWQRRERLDCDASRRGTLLEVFTVDRFIASNSPTSRMYTVVSQHLQRGAAIPQQQLEILERLRSGARCLRIERMRCQID